MAGKTKIEYSLELDVSGWQRGINAAIRDVRGFEQSLDRAIKNIDQFEASLNTALKGLKDGDVNIDLNADTSDIETALDRVADLDSNISFSADVDALSINEAIEKHDQLKENTSFEADANDVDLNVAKSNHDALRENTSFTVNVNEGTMSETIQKLLAANAAVELTVNATGMVGGGAMAATGGLASALGFVIDPLIATDTAVQRFEARTGQSIENLGEMIDNVWAGGWGESQAQVGDVMRKLTTDLNVPADEMEHVTTRVLDAAEVLESDYAEVISAVSSMVKSGFASDFEDAFNIIQKGQEEGLNKFGDWLGVLDEYSSTFVDVDMNSDEALTNINALLEGGVDTADRAVDIIREFGTRATTDLENNIDFFEAIGLGDEARATAAGEKTIKSLMDAVIKETASLSEVDAALAEQIRDNLFGTISEDFGTQVLDTLVDIQEQVRVIGTEAETASNKINDTMGVSWEMIKRTFQSEVADYFNNQLDFTGFMQRLKSNVSGFFDDLKSGEGFGDALSLNLAFALDETEFGGIVQSLIDTMLSVGETIALAMVAVLKAIDSVPGISVSSAGAEGIVTDIQTFRFNLELANLEEMDRSQFADYIEKAMSRANAPELIGNMVEGFETALGEEMSGIEAGTLLGNIQFARGQVPENMRSMFDPLIQEAANQASQSLGELVESGQFVEAIDVAQLLIGTGELPPSQIQSLQIMAKTAFEQMLQGGLTSAEIGDASSVYQNFIGTLNDPAAIDAAGLQLGQSLFVAIGAALNKGDFEQAGTIADILVGDLGEDEQYWTNVLNTAQLETEAQNIQSTLQTASEEGSDSLGLIGAATTEVDEDFGSATENMLMNYSKLTGQVLADSLLMETAFSGLGLAWTLLPAELRGALTGGFSPLAVPSLPGGGTGSTTNITQNNTFNNQNGAASAGSGQAAANAIRHP